MHSTQTQRSYHVRRLVTAERKGTLLTATLQWRIWKQNLGLLKPWSLLRALPGCCWEMSCSAPPPTLSQLAGGLSRDMAPAHMFRWLSECWDPILPAGSNNTWLKSSSWPVSPPLPKHKCSLHVTVWDKHFNGSSFRGLQATWLNSSSRHMRFYRWKSSQASISFLPALQETLFRRWDWDIPSSSHQSQFLSRIHLYLSQFQKEISDVGLQSENPAEEPSFQE